MASIKTKMAVGVFVIAGFGLAFVAIIWLGTSNYFEKGSFYAAYFDESVQGLGKDSPVKYRGVPIGRVASVTVAPDGNLIEVLMKIESGPKPGSNMVAQLKSVGITGIMFVELDLKAAGTPDFSPRLSFEPEHPVIATRPSDIKQFFDSFSQILDQMKALDLNALSSKFGKILDTIDQALAQARIAETAEALNATMVRVRKLIEAEQWNRILAQADNGTAGLEQFTRNAGEAVAKIDQAFDIAKKIVEENRVAAGQSIQELNRAMVNANTLLDQARGMVSGQGPRIEHLEQQLALVTKNLERATRNLDRLLEGAVQAPSQLIWGQPPAPRPVEGDAPLTEKRFLR